MKIADSIVLFLDYIENERRLSPLTVRTYGEVLHVFEKYLECLGINDLNDLNAREIRSWQASLMENGDTARTVMKKMSSLRSWHRYLRKHELVKGDPFAKAATLKIEKKLPVFYKEKEVERIYDAEIFSDDFDGHRDRLILRMLYETGMRCSELVGLKEGSVDSSAQMIKVLGKRNKQRLIPIENELLQNIQRYLALKKEIGTESESLFVTSKGKSITSGHVYRIVKKYMSVLSNADRISPHVFRHTFATSMLNEGANIDAVKELLGHSSLASTEIYTHVTREHLKENYKHAHPRAKKHL